MNVINVYMKSKSGIRFGRRLYFKSLLPARLEIFLADVPKIYEYIKKDCMF